MEIKKKQLLVKKSIEPVVTKDDIPTAAETEGILILLSSYFNFRSVSSLVHALLHIF